ncbi:MAG: hypothetical protein R2867_19640 [Caldilineaceae bacterium]
MTQPLCLPPWVASITPTTRGRRATMDAVFPACGQPNLFQELEEEGIYAHKVRKVYVSARGHGDTFVDISSTIDLKIEALKAHDSQVGKADRLAERIRERSAVIGQGKNGLR